MALLPKGGFDNWVVQVKRITQAPDGSAAIALQPPCRAMLASDVCTKSDYPIRGLVPPSSPLFREISKLNTGDFVLVSGKLIYADPIDGRDEAPAYGIYQSGSYYSGESQDEDLFVTVIRYLVQLQ